MAKKEAAWGRHLDAALIDQMREGVALVYNWKFDDK
jgi:hypothetical protein